MSNKCVKEVEGYFAECKSEGEKLAREVFPEKVLEMNKLYETEQFNLSRISHIHTDLNVPQPPTDLGYEELLKDMKHKGKNDVVVDKKTEIIEGVRKGAVSDLKGEVFLRNKVYILPCGSVPCNQHIVQLIDVVRPKLIELMDYCEKVVKWLKLSIPKIEDGNNFGVSIQTDTMTGVKQVETGAEGRIDDIFDYYVVRAKICSKVAKYPHLDDYRQSVRELDEKQFIHLRRVVKEISNHYAFMYDVITKNLDKLKNPRSSNADSLY